MNNRIKELDALRGIASISVVLFHLTFKTSVFKYGFYFGCMGVDLFFIISGFVILMSLENCKNWKDFLVSRFSRLFPAYWASVTLTAIVALFFVKNFNNFYGIDRSFFPFQYLCNLTMIQYYFHVPDIDATYWTLIIELNFYLGMFILFVTNNIKNIEKIGFVITLLLLILILNYDNLNSYVNFDGFFRNIPLMKYFPLFFSGTVFFKIKSENFNFKRFFLLIFSFVTQLFLFKYYYRNNNIMTFYEYFSGLIFIYTTLILFVFNKLNFIVNKAMLKLGEISYPLYMNHYLLGSQVILLGLLSYGFGLFISVIGTFAVVLCISFFINIFIEKPSQKFIRTKYNAYKIKMSK